MGTDIHPIVQVRRDGAWQDVEIPAEDDYSNILDGRHYDLFSILANVRNGRGCAGVVTGSGFTPIAEPRGLPDDFPSIDGDGYVRCVKHAQVSTSTELAVIDDRDEDGAYDCGECTWLGDHSHTWVTVRELVDYDWDAPVAKAGAMYAEPGRRAFENELSYIEWMKEPDFLTATPRSYFGSVAGGNLATVPEEQYQAILRGTLPRDPRMTYVVSFARTLTVRQVMSRFLADEGAFGWLKSLGDPDDVRIVMGFDS